MQPNRRPKEQNIAVIGLGYVGLPLALLASKNGYNVYGIDNDERKIQLLKKRIAPIADKKIDRDLAKTSINYSTDFSAISNVSTIIICVPTPVGKTHLPDLRYLKAAVTNMASFLSATKKQLVIVESTINPGVSEKTVLPLIEKKSNLKSGKDFLYAHCPERINPGDKQWNVSNIPRVIGGFDKESVSKASSFYSGILSSNVVPMGSLQEAEAVKIVENSFRDINIAFVNELALSFARLGIDVVKVIEGAATKPFGFMAHYPGCGVGGHCIPVDPYYLIEYAKQNGFYHDFLQLARRINNSMPKFTVEKVSEGLNEQKIALNGTKVAILGLAYKAEVDDKRESPSAKIIEYLRKKKAIVNIYDPYIEKGSNVSSLREAINGSKAVVLATNHQALKQELSPGLLKEYGVEVVVDGRNCLDKKAYIKAGINYKGIGR